jgi:hypothetical protein
MFTKFKRKYIYPIRWWVEEYKSAKKIVDISAKKLARMRRKLAAEAKKEYKSEDKRKAYIALGKIEVIDYIMQYVNKE